MEIQFDVDGLLYIYFLSQHSLITAQKCKNLKFWFSIMI